MMVLRFSFCVPVYVFDLSRPIVSNQDLSAFKHYPAQEQSYFVWCPFRRGE
jgi:hypothetical protein